MSTTATSGYAANGGYTCGQCGMYVMPNSIHFCSTQFPKVAWPQTDHQVLAELKAIHQTLKAILERLSL